MYLSLSEVAACVKYSLDSLEPSKFSTYGFDTGFLRSCTGVICCLKMEGLLLGRAQARVPSTPLDPLT